MAKPKGKDPNAGFQKAEQRIQKALKSGATKLDLSSFGLTALPDSIAALTQLQVLSIGGNKLTGLPEFIAALTNLQTLDAWGNQLTALPESIGALTNLVALYGFGNKLTALPESIGVLTKLQQLHVWGNQLTALPESIAALTQLQWLGVSNNQLTALPESIAALTKLQSLDVSKNRLTHLPESIAGLTKLQWLGVANNQLTALPESIAGLTKLQALNVANNQLTALPESIAGLTKLQALYVADNQLTALPESLRKLKYLTQMFLHGNDGLGLPPEVLGPTWLEVSDGKKPAKPADILDYYFRIRAGKRPLNEAKLILVGRGGVGKTSLVNRLLHERFDKDEKKTEGICISEWKLRLRGQEDIRLNLWDFGGQEIMHATHQFFLTQRSLYLLVLEGRQGAEDADAEYWLKLIESFAAESDGEVSPVIVVLNKTAENPFDLNRRALRQKYSFIRDFIATDCAGGTGMKELCTAIERETDQMKYVRASFPASWFAIKDKLAGLTTGKLKKSFLSFDEYRALCAENGEKEPGGQDSLGTHLHNLGIALNFKDDPRLRDTHVLNPHWVTNGIYKVLNSPLLKQQKGELRLGDAAKILDLPEYPRNMHPFLFDLMKKFQLCFTYLDDDTHYLIPELLDKQEAPDAAQFYPAECLNFEYRYPILPEGLLPRFIVRTHNLSTGLSRWRTGVILAFEGNRALVKADVQDKRIFIAVTGPTAGRRRLLAVIRSDLERIHADISKLKPEAFVPVPGNPGESVPYDDLLVMEREGERKFKKPINGRLVEIDVLELLNGVDLEGTRPRQAATEKPVRLFYSYAHKDEALRNELETHLKLLQRTGVISEWHDRKIEPGDDWKKSIDENLENADIILLLVSADFIASDYCYEKEMKRALERQDAREATVIAVVVRDVNWKKAPFAKLQALPKDAKAVTMWADRDSAWRDVSEGIERVAEQLRNQRGPRKPGGPRRPRALHRPAVDRLDPTGRAADPLRRQRRSR